MAKLTARGNGSEVARFESSSAVFVVFESGKVLRKFKRSPGGSAEKWTMVAAAGHPASERIAGFKSSGLVTEVAR